jgi:hypothetical protein
MFLLFCSYLSLINCSSMPCFSFSDFVSYYW